MAIPTNCGAEGQKLVDLFSCFAQNMGAQTAAHVQTKINELVDLHDLDIETLHQHITNINAELAADDTALQGILDAIAALQVSVANNSTSISQVNTALSQAVTALEASIQAERAYVDSEIARLESLMPNAYDDSELRSLIQANVEAIGSEAATRASEIARVEALVSANTAEIQVVKDGLAANAAAISALTTRVSDLETAVAANKAEADAKFVAIDACMNGFFSALDSASCDAIGQAFSLGLSNGNNGNGAGAL